MYFLQNLQGISQNHGVPISGKCLPQLTPRYRRLKGSQRELFSPCSTNFRSDGLNGQMARSKSEGREGVSGDI